MPSIAKNSPKAPWYVPREKQSGRTTDNSKFYNSTPWRKFRASYLLKNPLCVECLKEGKYSGAKVLDHIVQIIKGGAKLSEENVQGLCHSCHNSKSGREGAAATNSKYNQNNTEDGRSNTKK